MSLAIINLNDAGVQVAVDGDLIQTSPGYAVLSNGNLMVGEEASQNARLLPRWTNNRFWGDLSVSPLPNSTDQVRHHADLAFAHLEHLWQPIASQVSDAVLVVPGYYENEQLGLLLGMAKECQIPVSGMVDASVVAAANLPLRPLVLHLDIHLHSITLTRLSNAGTVARRQVQTVVETGLFTFWDRWANVIANQFIQSTRFDPLHEASSEQLLFNQLPGWITNLGDDAMNNFKLQLDSAEHTVAVSNENLLKACAPLYPQIVQAIRSLIPQGETASLLLSHRFEGFPGLRNALNLIEGVDVIDLAELKVLGSARLHHQEIVGSNSNVSHVTQLSAGEQVEGDSGDASLTPTHLLWQHKAMPIGQGKKITADPDHGPRSSDDPACVLYLRGDQMTVEPTSGEVSLNGESLTDTRGLQAGDQLTVNGVPLTLISVMRDG